MAFQIFSFFLKTRKFNPFIFTNGRIKKELTNNLFVFLIAGFDTTSTALSYCFYCLSKIPKEMEKLQEEIDSMIEKIT